MSRSRVGILGGSGLYDLSGIDGAREQVLDTPFGAPSDVVRTGEIGGVPVAFLARHGRGHRLSPSRINYRANIFAMKSLGCDAIVSASAVGSLREELPPASVCLPDQFIDRTRGRANTFFDAGPVVHVSLASPVCPHLVDVLAAELSRDRAAVSRGGTYVCMEGPQFSTRAESQLYRSWGADVIGMTNLTEARLAREAEICYATMALVTDYDCWRENTEAVSVENVLSVLKSNARMAERVLTGVVSRIDPARSCTCREALRFAVITDLATVAPEELSKLSPLLSKYIP